jgi:hypothetical protein
MLGVGMGCKNGEKAVYLYIKQAGKNKGPLNRLFLPFSITGSADYSGSCHFN